MAKTNLKKYGKPVRRNAGPPTPRAPRASSQQPAAPSPSRDLERLWPYAAGAAGTAIVGTMLAREGVAPKTIAGGLALTGGLLGWRLTNKTERNLALAVGSAALAQLVLLKWGDVKDDNKGKSDDAKPRQARALPPGALESAFERARRRVALDSDEAARFRRR